jgi:hypothetical protein
VEMRAPSDSRWAGVADALVLILLTVAVSVLISGGAVTSLWGRHVSITSARRVLMWAALVVVVRHVIVPRPSLLARVASTLARPRAAGAWLAFALTLCALGVATARWLKASAEVTDEAVRRHLFAELQPLSLANCQLERFGEANDGGYLMCGNLLEAVTSGYSYGISGYDKWGCDISTRLGVEVHEYDCFDPRRPSCPAGKLHFHDECVAGRRYVEDGRLFDTLSNQTARNGDASSIFVLKIDVEGAEWDSFLQTPEAVLDRMDQIAVEFHGTDRRSLAVVRMLKQRFYVAHVHFNNAGTGRLRCGSGFEPFPAGAYEVLLVNKRIGKPASRYGPFLAELRNVLALEPAAIRSSPLAAPNFPNLPDCGARQ